MFELVVLDGGSVGWSVPVGTRALTVGRAPSNALVLSEPSVSGHHAVVWVEGAGCWLRDLGSSNGTFVNGTRLRAPAEVRAGDELRFGIAMTLRVRAAGAADNAAGVVPAALVLEDLSSSVQFPIVSDRFVIGAGASADLRLQHGPDVAATLLVYTGSEVWLGIDGEDRELGSGDTFTLGGREFKLRALAPIHAATAVPVVDRYRYKLVATLSGPTGPEAEMTDPTGPAQCRIPGGNRAILLYLLGKRVAEERAAGRGGPEVGWCPDDEVMSGLWGRHGDENKLHVLLHRLRADLRAAGFDPWFIEKRHRFVRARLADVEIR